MLSGNRLLFKVKGLQFSYMCFTSLEGFHLIFCFIIYCRLMQQCSSQIKMYNLRVHITSRAYYYHQQHHNQEIVYIQQYYHTSVLCKVLLAITSVQICLAARSRGKFPRTKVNPKFLISMLFYLKKLLFTMQSQITFNRLS